MSEFLSFSKKINNNTYMLAFSEDIDSVWGESWNVCPASIIGGIDLDKPFISSIIYFNTDFNLLTAGTNNCFSMQDCIDGIFPLIYSSLEEEPLFKDNEPFFIKFGESKENVKSKLEKFELKIDKEEENYNNSDDIMNSLMDELDGLKLNN